MLVESIVRQTLGIKRHVVKKVVQSDEGIEVQLDIWKRRKQPCGACGTLARVRDRLQVRRWRHVPLFMSPRSLLVFFVHRDSGTVRGGHPLSYAELGTHLGQEWTNDITVIII